MHECDVRRWPSHRSDYLCQQVLRFPSQSVWELPAPRRQVQDGCGRHVGRLHVVGVVKAALTAGAAGTAASFTPSPTSPSTSSTAQAAAAAGSVAAGRTAGRAWRLTVALCCRDAHTHTRTGDWLDWCWHLATMSSRWVFTEDLNHWKTFCCI